MTYLSNLERQKKWLRIWTHGWKMHRMTQLELPAHWATLRVPRV